MLALHFDVDDLINRAKELGAVEDQLPYIFARTMNDAAEATRSYLIAHTWPASTGIKTRNHSFMQASLTTRDSRALKGDLQVEIYDKLDRGNLQLHAKGGTRVARGGNLAIGGRNVHRGAHGIPKSQKPRALKNAFRKGNVVYQRQKNGRLKLMYVIQPTAPIRKAVPFYEDFATQMNDGMIKALPRNVALAMKTRR